MLGIEHEFGFFADGTQLDFRGHIAGVASDKALRSREYGYFLADGGRLMSDGWEAEVAIPPEPLGPGALSRIAGHAQSPPRSGRVRSFPCGRWRPGAANASRPPRGSTPPRPARSRVPRRRCRSWPPPLDPQDCGLDFSKAVPLTGRAGDMTIHHVRLVHGSALNRSNRQRRLLLWEYAAADAWPLVGPKGSYQAHVGQIVRGVHVDEVRMQPLPVRLPYPPAPHQGSIYENQKHGGARFFETFEQRRATAF